MIKNSKTLPARMLHVLLVVVLLGALMVGFSVNAEASADNISHQGCSGTHWYGYSSQIGSYSNVISSDYDCWWAAVEIQTYACGYIYDGQHPYNASVSTHSCSGAKKGWLANSNHYAYHSH